MFDEKKMIFRPLYFLRVPLDFIKVFYFFFRRKKYFFFRCEITISKIWKILICPIGHIRIFQFSRNLLSFRPPKSKKHFSFKKTKTFFSLRLTCSLVSKCHLGSYQPVMAKSKIPQRDSSFDQASVDEGAIGQNDQWCFRVEPLSDDVQGQPDRL